MTRHTTEAKLARVVTAAHGLRVAERGAPLDGAGCDLWLADVTAVSRPDRSGEDSLTLEGRVWRRLWSLPDRLVIDFVEVVVVEILDCDGSVVFDRALPQGLEQHLLLDHVLPLVLARRGEMVLHGAVVIRDERAIVLVGPSGVGKSTLTTFVGRCGWTVGGDDGAVIGLGPPISVEPTYSTIRMTPEALALLDFSPTEGLPVAGKRRVSPDGFRPFRQSASRLAVVACLDPVSTDGVAAITRLQGVEAHVALLRNTFHVGLGRSASTARVIDGLARVAEAVPIVRLQVPRGVDGLASAEAVLREWSSKADVGLPP